MTRGKLDYTGTERVARLPASELLATGTDYALKVSVLGGKPERFVFDQPRLTVGRGGLADLRIEHACVSREQFVLERSVGSAGEPRFRIVPGEHVTNPTYVNEHVAVEGTLMPGDTIAVGEVRVVLENRVKKREAFHMKGPAPERGASSLPPLRMLLLAVTVVMALVVGYLVLFGEEVESVTDLEAAQSTPLFEKLPEPRCKSPVECDTRAHESYDRGRKLMATARTDPGNRYRAALEFARARAYREQSGRPLGDIADVEVRAETARKEAEAAFDDGRFALKRAIAAGDTQRAAEQAAALARLVPDEDHPYRLKLDAYRRALPRRRPKAPATLEAQ